MVATELLKLAMETEEGRKERLKKMVANHFPPDMIYSLHSFSYGIKYLCHGNIGIIVR